MGDGGQLWKLDGVSRTRDSRAGGFAESSCAEERLRKRMVAQKDAGTSMPTVKQISVDHNTISISIRHVNDRKHLHVFLRITKSLKNRNKKQKTLCPF